jgi:hypothetical protein
MAKARFSRNLKPQLPFQNRFPILGKTEIGHEPWRNEGLIGTLLQQTGRLQLELQFANIGDGGIGSVEGAIGVNGRRNNRGYQKQRSDSEKRLEKAMGGAPRLNVVPGRRCARRPHFGASPDRVGRGR